jgi:hypothetical protein
MEAHRPVRWDTNVGGRAAALCGGWAGLPSPAGGGCCCCRPGPHGRHPVQQGDGSQGQRESHGQRKSQRERELVGCLRGCHAMRNPCCGCCWGDCRLHTWGRTLQESFEQVGRLVKGRGRACDGWWVLGNRFMVMKQMSGRTNLWCAWWVWGVWGVWGVLGGRRGAGGGGHVCLHDGAGQGGD